MKLHPNNAGGNYGVTVTVWDTGYVLCDNAETLFTGSVAVFVTP